MEGILNAIRNNFWKQPEKKKLPPLPAPVKQPLLDEPPVSGASATLKPGQPQLRSAVEPAKQFYTGVVDPTRNDLNKPFPEQVGAGIAMLPPSYSAPIVTGARGLNYIPKAINFVSELGKTAPGWNKVSQITEDVVRKGPAGNIPYVPEIAGFAVPLMIGEVKPNLKAGLPTVSTGDELASVVARQFEKKAGQDITLTTEELLKTLKGKFELSDELLKSLDNKPLVGDTFAIEKTANRLEFIFDEGFKPMKKVAIPKNVPKVEAKPKEVPVEKQGVKMNKTFIGGKEATPQDLLRITNEEQYIADMSVGDSLLQQKYGKYTPAVQEMIGKIRRFGDSVDPQTQMLYREHIASTKMGYSSDELATALGMTENELMADLQRIADGGKVTPEFKPLPVVKEKQTGVNLKRTVIKPESEQVGFYTKGKTVDEVANPTSRPINENEFDAINQEANSYMREQYGLNTPKQYSKQQARIHAEQVAANKKLEQEAFDVLNKGLVSAEGKGDIRVPFSDFHYTEWNDKHIALLNREIPMRNIEDVAGKDAPKVREFFFDRVAQATQQLENFVTDVNTGIKKNIIDKLKIAPNSPEDKLVMQYGEGKMTKEELMAAAPDKWQNIIEADTYFRALYDDILNKINDTLTKYGYEPVKRRNDYYTHYQEIGNLFQQLGNITRSEKLPAWLNGLTADFKPGKQFFKFAQPRLGGQYTESAIGAMEQYLRPAARQIFNTDVIQRGRALQNTLLEAIRKNEDLPPSHLSDFMAWLNDYVNTLSGKKSLMARGTEGAFGRPVYNVVESIKRQASANLVGGNISAALTNSIPLTQAVATTDKPSLVRGMIHSVVSPLTEANNFIIDGVQSSFLKRRFPDKELSTNLWKETQNKLGWLFYTIDKFTSNTVVSGKYFEGLKKGLTSEKAMAQADEYGMRLIGDRSFGQMPQFFQNQGIMSLFTQFQLEVNNQISFIFKDAPKYANADSTAKVAALFGEIALTSYLFNNVFEWMTGRRPAFDPIYVALKSADIWSGQGSVADKSGKTAKTMFDNLPFVSILTGGGRIPVAAGIPTPQDITDNPAMAAAKFGLIYFMPSGGYQLYKTIEGMSTYLAGYSQTPKGAVRFPVEQKFDNALRSALFGQYSTPESNKYYEGGETALGQKQSQVFKMLMEQDPEKARQYYNSVHLERDINGKVTELKAYAQSLVPELQNPETKEEARMKLQQRAEETKAEIQTLLKQTPETTSVFDVILGPLNSLIGSIIGVQAEEGEGLVPVDTNKPSTGELSPVPAKYQGISQVLQKRAGLQTGTPKTKTGVSVKKKIKFKQLPAPKPISLKVPAIKSRDGFKIAPLSKPPVPSLLTGSRNKQTSSFMLQHPAIPASRQ